MERSIRQLTRQVRRSVDPRRISRSLGIFAGRLHTSLSQHRVRVSDATSLEGVRKRLRTAVQALLGRDPSSPPKDLKQVVGQTRRSRQRNRVFRPSIPPEKMREHVFAALKAAGLWVEEMPLGKLRVTWPLETDLDEPEEPEEWPKKPLSIEIEIGQEQGVKFRRISGPEVAFRRELQSILALINLP